MKYILTHHIVILLFALVLTNETMSQKISSSNKITEINSLNIKQIQKGKVSALLIDPAKLKKGFNYLILESKDTLFVEYNRNKITSVAISRKSGWFISYKPISASAEFACSTEFCMCSGDTDCNDMFTTNVCGPKAVCFGNLCICAR
jgi:hypothetical protein